MGVKKGERMLARELAAGASAAKNGLRRIGEIGGRAIVFDAAAFAIAEKKAAIVGAEESDEFAFQNDSAGIFYSGRVGSKGVGKGFIDFHPVPPDLSQVSS